MRALLGTIVCKFGGDPATFVVEVAICTKFTDGRTDRQTDGRTTDASRLHKLIPTRGRLRAGPSLQLGTLSTRIANLLCIIHSALARLGWRAYARRPCATHGTHTRAWRPSAARRQTDGHATDTTYQPTSRPFCQYPAVSWEWNELTRVSGDGSPQWGP